MPTTITQRGYRATKTDAGLVIHDVEIFCDCKRGDFEADTAWVQKAVKKAFQEAREGFYPPLHVRHHEAETAMTDAVKSAGTLRITGIKAITLGGKRRHAIIADYHVTDAGIAKDLIAGKLPYRSVEIFDTEGPPYIDGLALLDHEAPFVKLPVLMVSQLDDQSTGRGYNNAVAEDVIAPPPETALTGTMFRAGHCINPLSREESNMSATAVHPKAEFGEGIDKSKVNMESDDAPPKKDGDDDDENMEGDEGFDWKACAKAIETGKIPLEGMDAIQAAIDSRAATVQEPEPEAAPAAAPGGEAMKAQPTAMSASMAAAEGKIAGLEIREKERDVAEECAVDVRAAMKRLDSLAVGDLEALEAKLVAFRKDCGSTELFTTYVDALANSAPVEDGSPTAMALKARDNKTTEVAMKYLNTGAPGDVDRAANFSRQWSELHGRGLTRMSEEDYVRINMTTEKEVEA